MEYKSLLYLAALFLTLFGVAGCSSKNDPDPVEGIASDTLFGRLFTVRNLAPEITDDSNPNSTTRPPMYFSLESGMEILDTYIKTNRWDLAFLSVYNANIGPNNGTNIRSLGYQGPGLGAITILKQKFEDVTDIPPDSLFNTGTSYGPDNEGAFGQGTGWYLYDFAGNILGDNSYEKMHVAYAMKNRTLVVRTAKGNYAKIKMISIYKDETDPAKWFRNSVHPYFTFQYVLAKKGTTKFAL